MQYLCVRRAQQMVVQPMPGVKVRSTDNDTICNIIRNSHMKCCGILFGFCNPFLHIYLSASIYSKVPKTKSCLFVDIWVKTCVVKYYLEKKKHFNKPCFYSIFLQGSQYDPMVLLTWLFSWYHSRIKQPFPLSRIYIYIYIYIVHIYRRA